MTFEVLWLPDAEAELAAIWLNAADRTSVTVAANQLDSLLRYRPDEQGESRSHNQRILFCKPLAILYSINQESGKVDVIHVWSF